MYYSPEKTLSHNCMLNMVVSGRGAGKSYGTLAFLIKKWKESGDEFVYIRRSEVELCNSTPNLFKAHESNGLIEADEFKCVGNLIINTKNKGPDSVFKTCGYSIPLTKARQFKSTAYPSVKYILFDEFIDENSKYFKNEVNNLISIIETIARMRKIYVILLGNLITKYNPYFNFFNIDFDYNKEFMKDKKRGILVHNYSDKSYEEKKSNTPFSKMVRGTLYGEFILSNKNILDNDDFIIKVKHKNKTPYCNFVFNNYHMCCYIVNDTKNSFLYVDNSSNKNSIYNINMDGELKENYFNYNKNNPITRMLKKYAANSLIYFSDGNVKNNVQDLVNIVR